MRVVAVPLVAAPLAVAVAAAAAVVVVGLECCPLVWHQPCVCPVAGLRLYLRWEVLATLACFVRPF